MKMQFRVVYEDREVDVTAKPVDIMEYERHYGTSFMGVGAHTPTEHYWYMAWTALHRQGLEPAPFDVFMTQVDDLLTMRDEVKPAVPTKRGRSGGKSPASQ